MSAQMQIPAQQITLDEYAARTARERAVAQVLQHAAPAWKEYVLATVKRVAETHREFTTDAVLDALTDAPVWTHELRALGPVMSAAARAGYIRPTDRLQNSHSVSRHKAPKRVWESLVYVAR